MNGLSSTATDANAKPAQATQLLELLDQYPVFVDQTGRCFITVKVADHSENWSIDTSEFTEWLAHLYYRTTGRSTSRSSLNDVVTTLKGSARHCGTAEDTYLRAGVNEHGYWIDLGDPNWTTVHVTPNQWILKHQPEIKFYRKESTKRLPLPERNASIEPLWGFINIPEQDQILILTLLIDYLRPDTAHPLLILDGEQGSAKSTTQRVLKRLIDPSAMPLRVAPKNEQDLFIAAANDYVLSYNNISSLSGIEQDALCNLSTGGTYAKRALYSDNSEVVVNIQRPVILNGIGTLVTEQDLLERCIYIRLPIINLNNRITEREIEQNFEEQRGKLLGGLLDIMIKALAILPSLPQHQLPRMADFVLLGRAVAISIGKEPGYFDDTYRRNQLNAVEIGLENCPIYPALTKFIENEPLGFYGIFADLLTLLERNELVRPAEWPRSAKGLANMLRRIAPALRKLGYTVTFDERRSQEGMRVTISKTKISTACT